MNTKNYIFILAGAALLVSCCPGEHNRTGTGNGPTPTPVPCPGKRTENGTVIAFTNSQIRLRVPVISSNHPGAGTQGTFLIDRTECTSVIGTLAVGSTVTVESPEADWHPVSS